MLIFKILEVPARSLCREITNGKTDTLKHWLSYFCTFNLFCLKVEFF